MIGRRDLLRAGMAGAGALALGGSLARAREEGKVQPASQPKRKIPVAIATMAIDADLRKEFAAAMKKVAGARLKGVEFSYNFPRLPAKDVAKVLADTGLAAIGACGRLDAKSFEKTVEYYREVGCRFVIAGDGPKVKDKTAAPWLAFAKQFNEWQEKLKPLGMRSGWHNHPADFKPLEDGQVPWEIVFRNTVADVVMELDTGNAPRDVPQAMLKNFPRRAKLIHLKDLKGWGKGLVKFPEIFELCESVGGTEWYIVEQYGGGDWDARIAPCLAYLREHGRL